jgi:hypothetical protein
MPGYISSGVVFSAGDGATPTEVFATVAQVQEVKWSGYSRSVVDSRVLGDLYPQRMLGPHETQNVEMKLLFDPGDTAHESIRTRLIAGTQHNYRITLPDPGAYQVAVRGFFTKFEVDALTAEGGEIVVNATLELTALPVVTP